MNAIKKIGMAAMTTGFLFLASGPVHAAGNEGGVWTTDFQKAFGTMKMMKMMDTDGDHKVTKEEFMNHMEKIFAKMDKNNDGVLDVKEFMLSKILPAS